MKVTIKHWMWIVAISAVAVTVWKNRSDHGDFYIWTIFLAAFVCLLVDWQGESVD